MELYLLPKSEREPWSKMLKMIVHGNEMEGGEKRGEQKRGHRKEGFAALLRPKFYSTCQLYEGMGSV